MNVTAPHLQNQYVQLEPLTESHREPLRRAGADPELWRFHSLNQHGQSFDRWFDWSIGAGQKGAAQAFTVTSRGVAAGSSSYLAIDAVNKRLEIGSTWYAKAFQGGAVNPAVKLLLMGHVFGTLGWNRVEFKLDMRNTRSRAAMRKLGATEEGIFRAHMILPDGHVRDSVYFSVIRSDWPGVKAGLERRLAAF